MISSQFSFIIGTTNKMISYSNSKILLVLSFTILAVSSQDVTYGMRMPNFSGNGQTGGTGTTGGSGYSSEPSSSGPSGTSTGMSMTGRGRIVGNSIFDPEEPEMGNGNTEMVFGQQSSGFSPAITMTSRPIITGPSVVSGQMFVTDNGNNGPNSILMEDNSRENAFTRPAIPSGNGNAMENSMQEPKIHRFVSVHVPPPEPMISRPRPAQSTPKPETHYQIVFIKAPSASPQELQEIQMPSPPQMKTLVYVLLKKPEMSDFVKISQPPKVKPNKPEVFFIRYKGQKPRSPMMMMTTAGNNDNSDNNNRNNGTSNNNINRNQVMRPRITSTTQRSSTISGIGIQNSGGYDNTEIADSDFSHDSFNQNQFSLASYQMQNFNRQQQQQQVRAGFTYSPAASHYGISG